MPFEVFSPFMKCAEIHGTHGRLNDAAACYKQITTVRSGNVPTWSSSGKHIHVIAKLDRHGNILDFTPQDEAQAKSLGLPPAALVTEKPGIMSFSQYAKVYYEASRLIPISSLNLEGMFNYEAKGKHYWTTDAGIGHALACAQQVAFTLELSLKALLEETGKLVTVPKKDWQTHDLVHLYGLLDSSEQQFLQQQWEALGSSDQSGYKVLLGFLTAIKNLYMELRYVPALKSANLAVDIQAILNASRIVLSRSESLAFQYSPIKPKISITTFEPPPNDRVGGGDWQSVMVKGIVRSVNMPDDFEPTSSVEVIIRPIYYFNGSKRIPFDRDVTASFRRCYVESYFGLEGEEVTLGGRVTASEPSVLVRAQHVDPINQEPSYKFETRTLKGKAYNLVPRGTSYNDSARVTLILQDVTFLSDVDCLFVTEDEKAMIDNVTLGSEVTIRGQVALLNGRPISLVSPSLVS